MRGPLPTATSQRFVKGEAESIELTVLASALTAETRLRPLSKIIVLDRVGLLVVAGYTTVCVRLNVAV